MHRFTAFLRESLASLENHRLFRPWRHHLAKRSLWRFGRNEVARGAAVGLFFGVMTPVAQILFATIAAILLRANLLVAAGSTLITNPFTFPFVYYGAFRIGVFVTGPSRELAEDVAVSERAANRALDVDDWFTTLSEWMAAVGYPLLVGVFTLAVVLALAGYLLSHVAWAIAARLRGS
ncbi:MAG: DUF2062 domain-containing protein [Gammaproteobacteria bacterium]|nr:DUF2062 domain-containing protein [Gammaproteobacteria bacterium]